MIEISGNKEFLLQISNYFKNKISLSSLGTIKKTKHSYRLCFCLSDSKKIHNFLNLIKEEIFNLLN
jgi:hypothetical protein